MRDGLLRDHLGLSRGDDFQVVAPIVLCLLRTRREVRVLFAFHFLHGGAVRPGQGLIGDHEPALLRLDADEARHHVDHQTQETPFLLDGDLGAAPSPGLHADQEGDPGQKQDAQAQSDQHVTRRCAPGPRHGKHHRHRRQIEETSPTERPKPATGP